MVAAVQTIPKIETENATDPWLVLRCESGREQFLTRELARRDCAAYHARYREYPERFSRPSDLDHALWPGYLFVRSFESDVFPCLTDLPFCYRFLQIANKLVWMPHEEIAKIQLLEHAPLVRPAAPIVGQRVKVIEGVFAGVEGVVLKLGKKADIVVSFHIGREQRAMAVRFDADTVAPVPV